MSDYQDLKPTSTITTVTITPPVRKKAVNGKAKGSGFEGTIAKLLSTKFAPLQFRRSQSSGAILGGKNFVHMHKFSNDAKSLFIGDIVPTNEADVIREESWRFRFTIECKFYKEADTFQSLFKNPQVIGWFEQAKTDAGKISDKQAMLIFKFNHSPIFCAVEQDVILPKSVNRIISLTYALPDGSSRAIQIVILDSVIDELWWWKDKAAWNTSAPGYAGEPDPDWKPSMYFTPMTPE